MNKNELLRSLPKIDELLKEKILIEEMQKNSRTLILQCIRESIEQYRNGIINEEITEFTHEDIIKTILSCISKKNDLHLKRVINATGIIIHTNLGRSILCDEAIKNVIQIASGYSNL